MLVNLFKLNINIINIGNNILKKLEKNKPTELYSPVISSSSVTVLDENITALSPETPMQMPTIIPTIIQMYPITNCTLLETIKPFIARDLINLDIILNIMTIND